MPQIVIVLSHPLIILVPMFWSIIAEAQECLPTWSTQWKSSTGPYQAGLQLKCEGGRFQGAYPDGFVEGTVSADNLGRLTLQGQWRRRRYASSGGSCQYGQLSVIIAPDRRTFAGFWTYCEDLPTEAPLNVKRWAWTGTAVASGGTVGGQGSPVLGGAPVNRPNLEPAFENAGSCECTSNSTDPRCGKRFGEFM